MITLPLLIRLCLTLLIVTVSLSYNWKKRTTCFSFSDYARNQIKKEYVRMKYLIRWLCSIEIKIKARWKLKRKFQQFDWTLKFIWIQIARDKIYRSNWLNRFVNKEGFAFRFNIRIFKNQYHRRFYIFTKFPFERFKFKKVRCRLCLASFVKQYVFNVTLSVTKIMLTWLTIMLRGGMTRKK